MDCIFCKIIAKEIPAHKVYEDEYALGILDIHPRAPGHTMIIPRSHVETIIEVPNGELESLFSAVKKMTTVLKNALVADGFTIGVNHGKASGQEVDHLHIHIIPRWYTDDGSSVHTVVNNPPTESLAAIAEKIKKAV